MNEKIFCPAQTYRATRDSPAEHCENEVEEYGQLCAVHDEEAHADAFYDMWLDSLYDD